MAFTTAIPKGRKTYYRAEWVTAAGERRTIGLGPCGEERANAFTANLSALIDAQAHGVQPSPDLQNWLKTLRKHQPKRYDRLAELGLATAATTKAGPPPTLLQLAERYKERAHARTKTKLRDTTIAKLEQTARTFDRFWKARTPGAAVATITAIKPADAAAFEGWCTKQKLSSQTIRSHGRGLKSLARLAIDSDIIEASPFAKLQTSVQVGKPRPVDEGYWAKLQIGIEAQLTKLAKIPDDDKDTAKAIRLARIERIKAVRLLLSVAYYLGVRVPSETHDTRTREEREANVQHHVGMLWSDINWSNPEWEGKVTITIRDEKTHGVRVAPVPEELAALFLAAIEEAPTGATSVFWNFPAVNRYRACGPVIRDAKLNWWPKMFDALREARVSYNLKTFGPGAARWTHRNPETALRHYSGITATEFARAAAAGRHFVAPCVAVDASSCVPMTPDASQSESTEPTKNAAPEAGNGVSDKWRWADSNRRPRVYESSDRSVAPPAKCPQSSGFCDPHPHAPAVSVTRRVAPSLTHWLSLCPVPLPPRVQEQVEAIVRAHQGQ